MSRLMDILGDFKSETEKNLKSEIGIYAKPAAFYTSGQRVETLLYSAEPFPADRRLPVSDQGNLIWIIASGSVCQKFSR